MDTETIQLAQGIIRDHFGTVAEEVVRSLLEDGPQTLSELEGRLASPKGDVIRSSLTALIQHSIVTYTADVQRRKRKTPATTKSKSKKSNGSEGKERDDDNSNNINGKDTVEKEEEPP